MYAQIAPLAQTRVAVLSEVTEMVDFLFLDAPEIDDAAWAKAMSGPAASLLDSVIETLATASWDAEAIRGSVEKAGEQFGLKLGKAQAPVRVAVTGRTVGLPLFESLHVLGRERTLGRLRAARAKI